ncbi:MAG: hypothetical protein ACLTVV_02510 [Ruminococcus sp.]
MKQRIKDFQKIWKSDYYFSTVFSSAISTLISIVFVLYNGALGIVYQSWWHGLICVYYLLLATIRAILIGTRRKNQKTIRMITYLLLLVMDVSLIVPIYIMVSGERSYTYGLIPAIAIATYTTYRITISIVHFRKSRKKDKSLLFELRMINMTDALVAVLSLQNALIIANGGMNEGMRMLTAWTSGGIYLVIVLITIMSFIKVQRS